MLDWQLSFPQWLLAGWMILTSPLVCWCLCFKIEYNRQRGDQEDGVVKQPWFQLITVWGQEKMLSQIRSSMLIKKALYHFVPQGGNVATDKFSVQTSALAHPPFSFSLFLTLFSRRWSSINTQQLGIYQEDFVLSSEANNYQIWWKIEQILKLHVISFFVCHACVHAHPLTHSTLTRTDIYTQLFYRVKQDLSMF